MDGDEAALVSDAGGGSGHSTNGRSPYPSADASPLSQNVRTTPSSSDSKGSASRPWKSRVKSALGSLRKNRRASREKGNSTMAEPSSSEDSDFIDTIGSTATNDDIVKSLDFKLSSVSSGSPKIPLGARPSESNVAAERGGDATDPDLLAILREVSLKSSGAGRFESDRNNAHLTVSSDVENAAMRAIIAADLDDIDEAPRKSPKSESVQENNLGSISTEGTGFGIKSELPSTFQGERGGSAEDAELLALLRGVSAKSSGADRFADTSDDVDRIEPSHARTASSSVAANRDSATKKTENLPPWKRKGPTKVTTDDVVVVTAPPKPSSQLPVQGGESDKATLVAEVAGFGIKSELPSTFQGERGGSAEDAELLALLRGVSAKSSGADRFADTSDDDDRKEEKQLHMLQKSEAMNRQPLATVDQSHRDHNPTLIPPEQSQVENYLDRTSVGEALGSKDWKTRVRAFDFLTNTVKDLSRSCSLGSVESDAVLDGLDSIVPQFYEETQNAALDKALEFGLVYAAHCKGAANPEQARLIALSMLRKNAFSSRPSTTTLAHSFVMKLVEVGESGTSSLNTVVEVLLHEGMASKKPKIVQAASIILHDVTLHFGFANLPLATLVEGLPSLLAHTNAAVRDNGLKITAEICRGLGSKTAIQNVIDAMKSAQVSQLDKLIAEQPGPSPILTGLRALKEVSGVGAMQSDAVAALAARTEELEAERFAARPAVDLLSSLSKTDYLAKLQHPKWSEKVAALQIVLDCGGETPYKLAPPSSTVNYAPLIADMKSLLAHTHFAVCNKAMHVLCMLAEGVGDKLFPHLRPLLAILFRLSKDKKLTKGVATCLDSFFGNIIGFAHLLEDDALPASVDEKSEKNALARAASMEFLGRCVARGTKAGTRGALDGSNVTRICSLCTEKLDDSDASVRKASMKVLQLLKESPDPDFRDSVDSFIESLRLSNPRAHKVLAKPSETATTTIASASETTHKTKKDGPSSSSTQSKALFGKISKPSSSTPTTQAPSAQAIAVAHKDGNKSEATTGINLLSLGLDEATEIAASLNIPLWDEIDENGGIYAGLKSSKWLHRQNSIKSIINYIESGNIDNASVDVETKSMSLMLLVKEHTRGFKETNVNILKGIMDLFIAVCEYHESKERLLGNWIVQDGVELAIQKISDKKLVGCSKSVLTHLCLVASPGSVIGDIISTVKVAKTPVVHEESLRWVTAFLTDFGAPSLGSEVSPLASWAVEELKASNPKIKKEAQAVLSGLFCQLGPNLKALTLSLVKSPEIKNDIEICFSKVVYDPSSLPATWPKQSLTIRSSLMGKSELQATTKFDLPKTDLFTLLPPDTISKLGTLSGKAAWKQRKEALDDVERALSDCGGLVDSGSTQRKKLVELSRALKDRLSDTQINLKPIAARGIGTLLSSVDSSTQAKLGKIVYSPLINVAMTDIKKPMRDACLAALKMGTSLHSTEGTGLNDEAREPLISSVIGEITESTTRAAGLAEVLEFLVELTCTLPNLDETSASMGQSLGLPFAQVIVECLTSSKTETRSAATDLLDAVLSNNVISAESFRKAVGKLVPAKQRTVGPLVARYATSEDSASQGNPTPVESSRSRSASSRLATRLPTASTVEKNSSSRQPPNASTQRSGDRPHGHHPLQPKTNSISRPSCKGMVWPEYPEEPNGTSIIVNLKKSWGQILPAKSNAALFPTTGIRKQDEAKDGCDVLLRALQLDRESDQDYVVQQLDFVLKWTAFALCSRETTTGLQTLLTLVQELLSYLVDRKHELSDSEALDFVPYIIDRASNAKGRFGDVLHGIVDLLKKEELLSPKRLGSVICVAVIERSLHAKARALACQICHECTANIGLNGCGKRGVLAAAKILSEEKVAETRQAALNLLEVILSKMNGDIHRLSRICGPSLSDKATSDLEEKWIKRNPAETIVSSPVLQSPKFWRNTPHDENGLSSCEDRQLIRDELPSFRLDADSPLATGRDKKEAFPMKGRDRSDDVTLSYIHSDKILPERAEAGDYSEGTEYHDAIEHDEAPGKLDGTAASLRMRLLEIKEKSKYSDERDSVLGSRRSLPDAVHATTRKDVNGGELASLRSLLSKKGPLSEHDDELILSIEALKRIHAALSKQSNTSLGFSVSENWKLRDFMSGQIDTLVDLLTQLIGFSFDCGIETVNAKMSIPLLSVCLATLMALFRDSELSHSVSEDNLTGLIRQTGTALLDSRLGTSSALDEATASQMVRALNKLAVQAATGAVRQYSFMALLALQQQLSNKEGDRPFSSRLSRVILKLFLRVVKAEEGEEAPYSPSRIDMEALVCAMEDGLETSLKNEKAFASFDAINGAYSEMAFHLVQSIYQIHKGSTVLLGYLEALEIDPGSSALWRIVQLADSQSHPLPTESSEPQHVSRDVATLVSALGNAPEGPQREVALKALLSFKNRYGDEELNAHLRQVSSAFRSFIEDQLKERVNSSKHTDHESNSDNMSDRLRSLRSRLQATELALQTNVDDSQFRSEHDTSQEGCDEKLADFPGEIPQRSSKLLQPSPSRVAGSTTSSSLQERLAMAQDSRKEASLSGGHSSSTVGTSMGRAAALRARLEAVKNKGKST